MTLVVLVLLVGLQVYMMARGNPEDRQVPVAAPAEPPPAQETAPPAAPAASPAPLVGGTPLPSASGDRPSLAPSPSRREDPYRQFLVGMVLLERDGRHRLTSSQARRLLEVVRQAEAARTAVPDLQAELKTLLNEEQLLYIQRLRAQAGARPEQFAPEKVEEYARAALDRLEE